MGPSLGRGTGRRRRVGASVRAAARVGVLATLTMDAAILAEGVLGGPAFSSSRLNPEIIGRWASGLLHGRCRHEDITLEAPVRGELALGIATHYATGIMLTGAFLVTRKHSTEPLPAALAYGAATAALPLLVLFPSLGYGWFGIRSGEAARLIRIMFVGHVAFGAGIGLWGRRFARG
jgi:hypothetical protein